MCLLDEGMAHSRPTKQDKPIKQAAYANWAFETLPPLCWILSKRMLFVRQEGMKMPRI
jgi:hypothetical protein